MKTAILFLGILLTLGKSYGQNIDSLSAPPIVPYWAFVHWVWEDERNTQYAVNELTEGYFQHNIPVGAVIIDSPWMTQYNSFERDTTKYPNLQGMIEQLHKKGIRVLAFYTGCLNSSSYSGSKEKCQTYNFAVENNFCVNRNRESHWFKGPGVHVDMTNDMAKEWWHTQVNALHKMHLDGAKIDFGFAWFGDSIQTSRGILSRREFGFHYYGDAFDYHTSQNPEFVAMTYAWSGLGLMGFPSKSHVNWVGDFRGDWQGIKDQLRNIYLSANYGFSGIGCEIGGYWEAPSNKDQFIRYTQLSSLCPIMINGGAYGAFGHHLPWKHDEETVDIYRKFVNLHYSLSPYLFSTAVDAHLNNSTIIKNANIEDQSHMLGEQLFVIAITDSVQEVNIKFPGQGNWIDFWDNNKVYTGGSAAREEYDIYHYPVFLKKGTILPWQDTRTQTEVAPEKVIFLIYPEGKSSYTFHKPTGEGTEYSDISLTMDEKNGVIAVKSKNNVRMEFWVWQKCRPESVDNADKWNYDPNKSIITIEKEGSNFKLRII